MRVRLLRRSGSKTPAALVLARACQLERAAAEALVTRLGVLPRSFETDEAEQVVRSLRSVGVEAETLAGPATAQRRCGQHSTLESADSCGVCGAPICVVCVEAGPGPLCTECLRRQRRRLAFRNLRVALLIAVMACIGLWGWARQRRLDSRTQWQRPLLVSVVLVSQTAPRSAVLERWRLATEALGPWVTRESNRYRPQVQWAPVQFTLAQAAVVETLPTAPESAQETVSFERALDDIDRSVGVHRNDATLYVVLSSKARQVEGIGEAGGRRGLIFAGLDATEVTLESVALVHELLHCLGASDKYDQAGHARVPSGLVAPAQEPLFPQPAAEVMVGERPTGPEQGEPIQSLDEVQVGPVTAREIRWAQ